MSTHALSKAKRGPRPSSVSCPICRAPVHRACTDGRDGMGNTIGRTHAERRTAAAVAAAEAPAKRARLARKNVATARLGNAVAACIEAGVSEGLIREVVRLTLDAHPHGGTDG